MPYVFGGSSGGGGQLPTISFFGSQTWTPSYDITAKVFVIGGGGSGGISAGAANKACGGGAAGCAVSELTFASGTTYTITIGAGGASSATQNAMAAGNAGGASSLSGSGISTMTANGGSAGSGVAAGTGACIATGGSASGGTLGNFTGGSSGDCSANVYNSVSGGGAVGLWANGNHAPVGTGSAHGGKMGACINWDHDTFSSSDHFNSTHGSGGNTTSFGGVPTMSPFPNLAVDEREYLGASYMGSGGESRRATREQKAGQGTHYYHYIHTASTNYYGIAGPLNGGCGAGPHTTVAVAGRGSLGGGGGGVATGNNTYAYSGPGGDGGVLIFPSSIG